MKPKQFYDDETAPPLALESGSIRVHVAPSSFLHLSGEPVPPQSSANRIFHHTTSTCHSKLNVRSLLAFSCWLRVSKFRYIAVPSGTGFECRVRCKKRRWQSQPISNQPTSVTRCLGVPLSAILSALQANSHLHEVTNPQSIVRTLISLEIGQRREIPQKSNDPNFEGMKIHECWHFEERSEKSKDARCTRSPSGYIWQTGISSSTHQSQGQSLKDTRCRRDWLNDLIFRSSKFLRLESLINFLFIFKYIYLLCNKSAFIWEGEMMGCV